jgi:hypothetical protein
MSRTTNTITEKRKQAEAAGNAKPNYDSYGILFGGDMVQSTA